MSRKNIFLKTMIIVLVLLLLTACGTSGASKTPTPDAQTIYTQAALAAQAEATQMAALTPSSTSQPSLTSTLVVTPTPEVTTPPVITPTAAVPTATDTLQTSGSSVDQATLVAQSVANDSTFGVGETFKVTWTLKNTGKSTWTINYALKWYSGLQGDNLTVANTAYLASEVKPDGTTDISITFTVPNTVGHAQTTWYLQNTLTGVNILKLALDIEAANLPTTIPTATMAASATIAATETTNATTGPTGTAAAPSTTPTP